MVRQRRMKKIPRLFISAPRASRSEEELENDPSKRHTSEVPELDKDQRTEPQSTWVRSLVKNFATLRQQDVPRNTPFAASPLK